MITDTMITDTMITDTMRELLGERVQLIDVPLRLRNTPPVPPGTFMEAWGVDGELSAVERAAIRRDLGCCRACGFVAQEHQRAVALNGNRRDIDQTVTLCIFCHQCFHLDKVAGMESGVLIHLPELTQAELHHVAREIYVGRVLGGDIAATAQACLDALIARREQARARIGSDDPAVLAERLAAADDPAAFDADLEGIRLLPMDRRVVRKGNVLENLLPPILGYWVSREGAYPAAAVNTLPWRKFCTDLIHVGRTDAAATPSSISPSTLFGGSADTKPEGERSSFFFRQDIEDRFLYRIWSDHARDGQVFDSPIAIAEYRVHDPAECQSMTLRKLSNLVAFLRDETHALAGFAVDGTRLIYEIEDQSGSSRAVINFFYTDGAVRTKNATLSIEKFVFDDRIVKRRQLGEA
jgi:intracellular multiplication protein IcmJ